MSAHTPGPWTIEKHAPYGWAIRAPRERHLGAGTLLCELSGYDAEADAQLVAAAPELLAACAAALGNSANSKRVDRLLQDAIAKALGQP